MSTLVLDTDTGNALELHGVLGQTYGWLGPAVIPGTHMVGNTLGSVLGLIVATPGTDHTRAIQIILGTVDATSAPANTVYDLAAIYAVNNCNMGGSLIGVGVTTGPRANEGVRAVASGGQVGCGLTIGVCGLAGNSSMNIGTYGRAVPNTPNGPCVGVLGSAALASVSVGGWFTLASTDPTFESAALVADCGGTSAPVALFKVNGVTKVKITSAGELQVNVGGTWKNVLTEA